MRIEV